MSPHETVLRKEAVDALVVDPAGRYVDCTYGRGGHAREILDRVADAGELIVIDRDPEAISDARQALGTSRAVTIIQGDFANIAAYLAEHGKLPVNGVLLDLGVSSPQLDDARRGFSFMRDGPLDMRMDNSGGMTAQDFLEQAEEHEIVTVLQRYGEEKFARRIARAIVEFRAAEPIATTACLVGIIEAAVPRREKHKHPATRTFQALRIQVNQELQSLEQALDGILDALAPGGRLVVISFHSLEDRIVKRFIRRHERGDDYPRGLPIRDDQLNRKLKSVGRAHKPPAEEVAHNPRARSSIMRTAERL